MELLLGDILAWDSSSWSAALRFWSRNGQVAGEPLNCLEIGANRGGISAWLASLGHHVVCSDLKGVQISARPLIERAGLLDRVRFEDIDATKMPYEDTFDIVVFKSVLGGIGAGGNKERQRLAVKQIHRALRPGGRLLFAENLTGSPLHMTLRSHFREWGTRWNYLTAAEMRELLSAFSTVSFETAGFLGALGRSERQRRALARLDHVAVNAVVPPSWRYIAYGVAVK